MHEQHHGEGDRGHGDGDRGLYPLIMKTEEGTGNLSTVLRPSPSSSRCSSDSSEPVEEEEHEDGEEEEDDTSVVRWRPDGTGVDIKDCIHNTRTGEPLGVGPRTGAEQTREQKPLLDDQIDPIDLFATLGDSSDDSELDDSDCSLAPPLCLLSRSYYHIWSSRGAGRELLLPPAPGVEWHGHTKRPPLYDTDPLAQSTYYRKWSRPLNRVVRTHLDSMVKDARKGSKRRLLLAGQPQVSVARCACVIVCMYVIVCTSDCVCATNPYISHTYIFEPFNFHRHI